LDTENWSNIRGPRAYEDNTEYLKARAQQQKEANRRRRDLRKLAQQQQDGSQKLNPPSQQ
jgi:hypothetical protein